MQDPGTERHRDQRVGDRVAGHGDAEVTALVGTLLEQQPSHGGDGDDRRHPADQAGRAVQFDPVGQQPDERRGDPEGGTGTAAEQQGPQRTRRPQRYQGQHGEPAADRRGQHGQVVPGQGGLGGGDLHPGEQRGQAGDGDGRGGEFGQPRPAAGNERPDRQREQDRGHADRLDDRERRPGQRQHVQHLADRHDGESGQPDGAPQHLPQQAGMNDPLGRRRAGFLLLQGSADRVAQGRQQGRGHGRICRRGSHTSYSARRRPPAQPG